jgi:hypothetical protein
MTTNTVILIAVFVGVLLVTVGLSWAVNYRFRADRREVVGGIILNQVMQDTREDALARATRERSPHER